MELIVLSLTLIILTGTLYEQRKHNRQSVRAVLETRFHKESLDNGEDEYTFSIYNHGLGAARIVSITTDLFGKKGSIIDESCYGKFVHESLDPEATIMHRAIPQFVGPQTNVLLLKFRRKPDCENDPFDYMTNETNVEVKAESLYGEVLYADKKISSRFFSRIDKTASTAGQNAARCVLLIPSFMCHFVTAFFKYYKLSRMCNVKHAKTKNNHQR